MVSVLKIAIVIIVLVIVAFLILVLPGIMISTGQPAGNDIACKTASASCQSKYFSSESCNGQSVLVTGKTFTCNWSAANICTVSC